MHRWPVGSVEIVRVEDESFALPSERPAPAWAVPELAPRPSEIGLAFSAFAIADGDRRVVVDPWLANDAPRYLDDASARVDRLLAELGAAGFPADEVDTVVNTHFDGIGWNTRPNGGTNGGTGSSWTTSFPNARDLYPQAELDAWRAGTYPPGEDGLEVLEALGVLDGIALPRELSPHVHLQDAPGHNAGHLAVVVEDQGAIAMIPGHLFLNPFQVSDPSEAADLDPEVATASRLRILDELAERGGLLLSPLLGGPGGGVVRRSGPSYELVF